MYERNDIILAVDYHDNNIVVRWLNCYTGEERVLTRSTAVRPICQLTRHIPRYKPTYERVMRKRGKKIGRIVVARMMLRSIYKMLTDDKRFDRLPVILPKQRRKGYEKCKSISMEPSLQGAL